MDQVYRTKLQNLEKLRPFCPSLAAFTLRYQFYATGRDIVGKLRANDLNICYNFSGEGFLSTKFSLTKQKHSEQYYKIHQTQIF